VPRCQYHQHFYVQIFCTNVVSAAFSNYGLALAKNLYEKRSHKTVMKLTAEFRHMELLNVFFLTFLNNGDPLKDKKGFKGVYFFNLKYSLVVLSDLKARKKAQIPI